MNHFLKTCWKKSPVLTVLGVFLLIGFLEENHLLEPAFFIGVVAIAVYYLNFLLSLNRSSSSSGVNAMPFSPDSANGHPVVHPHLVHPPHPNPNIEHFHQTLIRKLESLEKSLLQVVSSKQAPVSTVPAKKEKKVISRSFLAPVLFLASVASLILPTFLFSSVLASKYLNRSTISDSFLAVFNKLHLNRLLNQVNPVDFDLFATFYGLFLIPALACVFVSLFIFLRTIARSQRGRLLAFFATLFFTISFVSVAGSWKMLMKSAQYWNFVSEQSSMSESEDLKYHLASSSFWKKMIIVKELAHLDSPQAYQILKEALPKSNKVLQQLILHSIKEQIVEEDLTVLEKLLNHSRNPQYQEAVLISINQLPSKAINTKLLEYHTSVFPEDLLTRFNAEDLPLVQSMWNTSEGKNKLGILKVLYHLDPENTVSILQKLADSSEEFDQSLALRVIENHPSHQALYPVVQKLLQSRYHPIHNRARDLMRDCVKPIQVDLKQKNKQSRKEKACKKHRTFHH